MIPSIGSFYHERLWSDWIILITGHESWLCHDIDHENPSVDCDHVHVGDVGGDDGDGECPTTLPGSCLTDLAASVSSFIAEMRSRTKSKPAPRDAVQVKHLYRWLCQVVKAGKNSIFVIRLYLPSQLASQEMFPCFHEQVSLGHEVYSNSVLSRAWQMLGQKAGECPDRRLCGNDQYLNTARTGLGSLYYKIPRV